MNRSELIQGCCNFIFLGEAGCGKSEIAVNLALSLVSEGEMPVHFFDLDMTKPLFRSRDVKKKLEHAGVAVHFEDQFMDAPTTTGWVDRLLKDKDCYVVMDIGGDYIGARSVGGYARSINEETTAVYYVVNPFRPWSMDIGHINMVMGEVLGVSHIRLEKVHMIGNPNLGAETTAEDIKEGIRLLSEMIEEYKPLSGICIHENMLPLFEGVTAYPLWPIQLHLTYPWAES